MDLPNNESAQHSSYKHRLPNNWFVNNRSTITLLIFWSLFSLIMSLLFCSFVYLFAQARCHWSIVSQLFCSVFYLWYFTTIYSPYLPIFAVSQFLLKDTYLVRTWAMGSSFSLFEYLFGALLVSFLGGIAVLHCFFSSRLSSHWWHCLRVWGLWSVGLFDPVWLLSTRCCVPKALLGRNVQSPNCQCQCHSV